MKEIRPLQLKKKRKIEKSFSITRQDLEGAVKLVQILRETIIYLSFSVNIFEIKKGSKKAI
ncbi:hypothetical protein [Bathymodiolus heckerae thiotrophic gill symbiont]|uniref:hypothetical protein n=1 Tax=Bathymodiolus heckerae thiotrophic gill symbiont TaxID=1052212 RepID=UPI0010FD73BA|nr:hypothetical protein [Bathymodiolus heckerae thiotrophic gill symbiont]